MDSLKVINSIGITVLLVEQKIQEALELANRGYVLAERAHGACGEQRGAAGVGDCEEGVSGDVGLENEIMR